MGTCDDPDFCPDAHGDESPQITPAPIAANELPQNLRRRTFLKAAALGTAAAALAGKGTSFGPLTALADDLSTFQCTANDVRIVGAGQIVNEPCECNGTFSAEVQFTVENNAASERGCITLHLVQNGAFFGDIPLQGTIAGKTTTTMTGIIENYPCGSGLQCFGSASGDGRRRCGAGECSTVSWTVPGQDTCPPDRQISSKCRHQQICIQGRGGTTLDCDPTTEAEDTVCAVPCGGTATVRLCTSEAAVFGPFTFALSDGQSFGPTSDACHDFEVSGLTEDTTVTGSVTSADGCVKSAEVVLTVEAITASLTGVAAGDCTASGTATFTASSDGSGCSYEFLLDGTVVQAASSSNEFVYHPVGLGTVDAVDHTVTVNVDCGGCLASASVTVHSCIVTTIS
jgi:hypothetical protein